MSECEYVRGLFPQWEDGDMEPGQSAQLSAHLQACAECRETLERLVRFDRELTAWGESVNSRNPAPSNDRNRLAAEMAPVAATNPWLHWLPPAAAALAIALALHSVPQPERPFVPYREPAPFVQIPYSPPLDPRENAAIVRMNIRVATLIAAGYRVTGDPDTIVPADVLVGEDGRAHAVRVLSGIDWSGTGD
jgi:hypothetical protein